MNPGTLLSPILGVFSIKLNREGVTIPIYFVMTRSLQGFDEATLDQEDLLFGFDIKGQV